jgi:hypothetical protein
LLNSEKAEKRINSLVLATTHIRPAALAEEARLMTLKWYDYRFMSPLKATLHFGRLYRERFKRAMAQHVDLALSKNVRGIDLEHVFSKPGLLTGLWTARQHADRLGIGYPEYLTFCFNFAMSRNRERLPQPNQLYFTEASRRAWIAELEKFWPDQVFGGAAQLKELPQYRFEYYRGLPAQDGYRQFIIDRAKETTRRWRDVMRKYSVERRELPIRLLVPVIGAERFLEELHSLRDDGKAFPFVRSPKPPVTSDMLWQSCFGVPHAYLADCEPCLQCPQAKACQRLSEHVLATVKRSTGTTDPVGARKREQVRIRVARHRAKQVKRSRRPASREGEPSPSAGA